MEFKWYHSSYPLDSLVSAECDDGVMCCSAIDDAEGHTRLLVWGLRRPPARATCPAPCQGERYDAVSASTALHWLTTTSPVHTRVAPSASHLLSVFNTYHHTTNDTPWSYLEQKMKYTLSDRTMLRYINILTISTTCHRSRQIEQINIRAQIHW